MIDNNIGVTTEKSYEIKKVNSDYFEEIIVIDLICNRFERLFITYGYF
jgi:hypothetical protein